MSVGTNIKKRRFELRMSQQDLADALGYSTRSTISKIESGENDVTQKKLKRIADALDTTPEALLTGAPAAKANTGAGRASFAGAGRVSSAGAGRASSWSDDFDLVKPDAGARGKTVAVILAGGKSSRNQQNIPNQFINILGKPVIVYCLEAYQAHPAVDDIYIVCLNGWEQIVEAYAEQYGITKLRGLIPASSSGLLSVKNGLEYVRSEYSDNDIIIFQESTRPMVSVDMISKLLQSCYENGSSNICQSMKDYVQFAYENGKAKYIDRGKVVDLQSPEAYRINVITSVFADAENKQLPLNESCLAMLLFKLGYDINFIEGNVNNIKIVRQEDVAIINALLRQ